MSFNLATILREPRREQPDKPLCHVNDLTFSYAQVDELSGRGAGRPACCGSASPDRHLPCPA
ncbi:hypothetical protein [Micromonospora sp. NPDC049497]|uniref:hypothetical protein n=1 Tax=Micromonospora sp. NPDC049497 TaxID=3364273 RepID=UPI00378DE4A2